MFHIRDAIHGDIALWDLYADIVDTPEFQRLRSIEQGSFRPVFPGARHDRFIHSLGTFHLATKFAKSFFRNIRKDFSTLTLSTDEAKALTATFLYAALLHDIGHAPYSHTTEDFFRLKKNDDGESVIEADLCKAIESLGNADESEAFKMDFADPGCAPSAHEIISATLLITNRAAFLMAHSDPKKPSQRPLSELVDPALAARMVIGCTYDYNRYEHLESNEKMQLGIRNCLIRLLNSSAVDVDRLDYLIRDTKMSGFINTPVNVDRLADSVTAIRLEDSDWLYPAFHNDALGVLESMFHAKREHDFWVLNHPAGAYDAALRENCISHLEDFPENSGYMTTIFTAQALGRDGVDLNGRIYRLLSDEDVGSDLKRHYTDYPLIQELTGRASRRTPIWKDYFEYRWLFGDAEEKVCEYFSELIKYMKDARFFQLNADTYEHIKNDSNAEKAREAAGFLYDFFTKLDAKIRVKTPDAASTFDLVLLPRTANLNYKFDPHKTYICFPRMPRINQKNYTAFADLKDIPTANGKRRMFYLYAPKAVLTPTDKGAFRKELLAKVCPKVSPRTPRV